MTFAIEGGDFGVSRGESGDPSQADLFEAERATFSRLYEEHRERLYLYCVARTRDADLADDIVQNTFVKAFTHYGRFDRNRPFWPWLASIAARECVNAHRREKANLSRADRLASDAVRCPLDPTATAVLEQLELAPLRRQMAAIPVRQRMALQLFAVDGWSYAEIAAQLGDSMGAVKMLIARARARLRDKVSGPLAGFLGGMRSLRSRLERGADRLQSAIGGALESWGSWASAAWATTPVFSVLIVGMSAMLPAASTPSAVLDGGPSAPPPRQIGIGGPPAVGNGSASRGSDDAPVEWRPTTLRSHQGDVERAANEAVPPVLWPYQEVTAEDAPAGTIAVSPSYHDDHTVFFSHPMSNAPLFVTRDGGASWTRLRALGFAGAKRLLLPPAYPRDPRIFTLGYKGLQVSHNGGDSFETILPNVVGTIADAALSPAFDAGHPTVLIVGGGALFEYRIDSDELHAFDLGGEWSADRVNFARYLSDGGDDPVIMLSTIRTETGGVQTFVHKVARCTSPAGDATSVPPIGRTVTRPLRCEEVAVDEPVPFYQFETASSGDNAVVYARTGNNLHVSHDGGRSFQRRNPRRSVASVWSVEDLAIAPGPEGVRAVVAVHSEAPGGPALVSTHDAGRTWTPLTVGLGDHRNSARAIGVTPTGRIVVGGLWLGILCSADGGRTWATTCPSPDLG